MSINVAQFVASAAGRTPDRVAWRFGGKDCSYGELARRAGGTAAALTDRGVGPGDRVVIHLPNGPEFVEVLLACFWGGYVAVPVHWQLGRAELDHVIADSGAAVVVSASTEVRDHEPRAVAPEVLEPTRAGTTRPAAVEGAEPAWIFYTSGTTGRPKGAVLSHRNLVAMTLNYLCDVDNVDNVVDGARFLHAAPLSHGSGLYLIPALARGATNVISDAPRFDPGTYFAAIEAHRITHAAFLAPTMLKRLTDHGNAEGRDLSSLTSMAVGGSPLYTADLDAARELFGPIVSQVYGQGESPMTITVMRADDPLSAGRELSTGRPFTGVEVMIADATGRPVGPWVAGEVCVRGDVVMAGYWRNPAATAATVLDGWLHTGDVGHLDEHGYLFLTDRTKDVIISGGSNVYPREVEEVLLRHAGVREAAVIGMPDREWGEVVCAVIVEADEPAGESALIEHCR
ncbi:MAG: AMP-binding protein, partial [Actinomycetota bacterium]|nr:AMP-binding protein [Actinomycetota bacterium]